MPGFYDYDRDADKKLYKRLDKSASKKIEQMKKKKKSLQPLDVSHLGRRDISSTFWGESWCKHLESFSDYENRLPRGRTYVRKGSIKHLAISKGKIDAIVIGNAKYLIDIKIKTIPKKKYEYIKNKCTGQISSLLELLGGHLSNEVMSVVTQKEEGLFPLPGEMTFQCSCPDWANMCKHIACTLYGVAVLLDKQPELLFELRGVNHEDLIQGEAIAAVNSAIQTGGKKRRFTGDMSEVFGMDFKSKGTKPLKSKNRNTKK